MGELVGGGYTLLYVYYLVWYTDLGGRGVFRRLTSLLFTTSCAASDENFVKMMTQHLSGYGHYSMCI